MTEQAQAEDRRAQIQAQLKEQIERIDGLNWVCAEKDCVGCQSRMRRANELREAVAELSRLSSVEQALRDILDRHCYKTDDIVASFNAMASRMLNLQWVCQQYGASVGLDGKALSASPEAQPEELDGVCPKCGHEPLSRSADGLRYCPQPPEGCGGYETRGPVFRRVKPPRL